MLRKQNTIIAVIFSVFIAAILLFPVDENEKEIIVFSKPSGFYNFEFDLTISVPDGWVVYYTLDGSDPNENSEKYEESIHIYDASDNPNQYSLIDDVSLGYRPEEVAEIIGEIPNTEWYKIPTYNIDKCTVIRAIAKRKGQYSEIATNVYYVGFNNKKGYSGINILSIVSDPSNLFDSEKGIYVLGNTWKNYKESGLINSSNWGWWSGNFSQRHMKSEREAVIHYFDNSHNLIFTQDIGIRIQGNSSRSLMPKSINMYTRKKYGGVSFPDIFKNGYRAKAITLFGGSQDYGSKIRDSLINDLVSNRDISTRNYIPCAMFLDGEYWGLYFLTEKFDEEWVSYRYSVDSENVVIFKNDVLEAGIAEDAADYKATMLFLQTADMRCPEKYEEACQRVDMQSLIDYYAVMLYIARYNDWPKGNVELWRTRTKNVGYSDGKWRWMIFDLNSGSSDIRYLNEDSIARVKEEDLIFNNLCNNIDFQQQFAESMIDIMNTSFAEDQINERISYYERILSEPMLAHNNRFFGVDDYLVDSVYSYPEDGFTYHEKLDSIRVFLSDRRITMCSLLEKHFNITPLILEDGTIVPQM
ncbi:MAG: hypothetical protein HFI21_16795 [Lachnospiraceae bacterium]|nr:hypothetical protein [Lachnospiraceae bacterium]